MNPTKFESSLCHASHTPGPWITETTDNGLDGRIEVVDSATEGTVIATLRCRSVRMGIKVDDRSEEFAANARLIAAAPELLATLKRITEKVARANAIQHSGGEILPEDWSELYDLESEAKGIISKAQ
jgi:hypothetical protein